MGSLDPVTIFKPEANEEKAEVARLSNFIGGIMVGDIVKSTFGPKGMDKLLSSYGNQKGSIKITNDGATILKSIGFDNPAARILVNMAVAQDDLVGDGTTSVAILASELLRQAEKMIARKIHPQTIITGYRLAEKVALHALESAAFDSSADGEQFRRDLLNLARTTLSSKILNMHIEKFSEMAVEAALRLKGSQSLRAIHIIKISGGTLDDSFLDKGFLLAHKLDQFQPKRIEKAKILIANTGMDQNKPKCFGSRVRVGSLARLAEVELAEKTDMKEKVENILKYGCNVFINRQLIYNYPQMLLAKASVMSIELAQFEGVERLALVTGGEILSTFDEPDPSKLGECDLVEEIMIGEEKLVRFSGVKVGEACTIVIRGSSTQVIDEAERALHDALCVLVATAKDKKMVYGGGAAEMAMSKAASKEAGLVVGKESVAVEAYAQALLELPTALSDNAGLDSPHLLSLLRTAHGTGQDTHGLHLSAGNVTCMQRLGVIEPLAVKRQVVHSSLEATELILRVDNILKAGPRKRRPENSMC